ncbi:hypothetical protein MTO96_009421 [Rhipicephalus appendiculatus]
MKSELNIYPSCESKPDSHPFNVPFITQLRSEMAVRGSPMSATELARRPLPMDRCWSVPFASALSAFLLVLNSSCYGFLYVLFMKKYGINHAEAAWPASALVIAGSSVCMTST